MPDAIRNTVPSKKERRADHARDAISVLNRIRNQIITRMASFIVDNQSQLRSEFQGQDNYSFILQQIEDAYLSKINALERALHELSRLDVREVTTTYEAIEVKALRKNIPQKLCDVLAGNSNSEVIDIIPLRLTDTDGELLVVFSTEERK